MLLSREILRLFLCFDPPHLFFRHALDAAPHFVDPVRGRLHLLHRQRDDRGHAGAAPQERGGGDAGAGAWNLTRFDAFASFDGIWTPVDALILAFDAERQIVVFDAISKFEISIYFWLKT